MNDRAEGTPPTVEVPAADFNSEEVKRSLWEYIQQAINLYHEQEAATQVFNDRSKKQATHEEERILVRQILTKFAEISEKQDSLLDAFAQKYDSEWFRAYSAGKQKFDTRSEEELGHLIKWSTSEMSRRGWIRLSICMSMFEPLIEIELQNPRYCGKSLESLFHEAGFTETGYPTDESQLFQAVTAARKTWGKFHKENSDSREVAENACATEGKGTTFVAPVLNALIKPFTKLEAELWSIPADKYNSPEALSFNAAKRGSDTVVPVFYAIDASSYGTGVAPVLKQLTVFDKFVYMVTASIYHGGYNNFSVAQVHKAMGATSRPTTRQLEKISMSLAKLNSIQLYVNTEQEAKVYPRYKPFHYRGSLLANSTSVELIKGKWTEIVHVSEDPQIIPCPLLTFAITRKQATSINPALLRVPVNKTQVAYCILDYLLMRIARGKTEKQITILHKTLFAHIDKALHQQEQTPSAIKKQRQRAMPTAIETLNHFKRNGYIEEFAIKQDAFIVVPKL